MLLLNPKNKAKVLLNLCSIVLSLCITETELHSLSGVIVKRFCILRIFMTLAFDLFCCSSEYVYVSVFISKENRHYLFRVYFYDA